MNIWKGRYYKVQVLSYRSISEKPLLLTGAGSESFPYSHVLPEAIAEKG
jgi:hypothetical protein